jgi:hypothetical protein
MVPSGKALQPSLVNGASESAYKDTLFTKQAVVSDIQKKLNLFKMNPFM